MPETIEQFVTRKRSEWRYRQRLSAARAQVWIDSAKYMNASLKRQMSRLLAEVNARKSLRAAGQATIARLLKRAGSKMKASGTRRLPAAVTRKISAAIKAGRRKAMARPARAARLATARAPKAVRSTGVALAKASRGSGGNSNGGGRGRRGAPARMGGEARSRGGKSDHG